MKGQAAVDYLITYGWAIFALVIVVGVLLTSGILSPNYLITEECNFGNNLPCQIALYDQNLGVNMFNGFPYKIRIVEIVPETDGDPLTGLPTNIELESGESFNFTATVPVELSNNDVKRFRGNLSYVSCAVELGEDCGTTEHVITGRITAKVIPQ